MVARHARRAVVVVATAAVVVAGAWTVQLAGEWRAAEAPLDAAPISASSVADDLAGEQARTRELEAQLLHVARQVTELEAAVSTAGSAAEEGVGHAEQLDERLRAARTRLATMQRQLRDASARLEALNRAAARQAAINARAQAAGTSDSPAREHDDGDDDEDDHDEDHDDDE
jgi:chromosome segregation ATPase